MINDKLLKELTGNELKVLLYFDKRIMDSEIPAPVRKIAEELNIAVDTVVRSIDTLIELQIITKVVKREGQTFRAYYSWNEKCL